MKELCFVFIFVIFSCYCAEIDYSYGETYVGNPDNFPGFVRPCPVYDLNCIRKFFAEHSHCKITNGPLPDAFVIDQYNVYIPNSNLTCSHTNIVTRGFSNTRVEEFYVNYATDQVVFAIEARNQTNFTPSSFFQFSRRGREPIVVHTSADILYRSITYTAVIPNIKNLQFDHMEVTAYLSDPVIVPPFTLGSEVVTYPDPQVQQTLTEVMIDSAAVVQQVLLTESLSLPPAYIQFNLCDFGYDKVKKLKL